MKTRALLLMGLFATLAIVQSTTATVPKSSLIVPGQHIGRTSLGPNGADTLKHLPTPYAIDRGMSQTRQVWRSSKPGGSFDTLFIHTTNNGVMDVKPTDGVTIDLIRVTAHYFHTANGVSTGSTLAEIQKLFPDAAPVEGTPTIYDDVQQGIAFEFADQPDANSRCIAIMIHPPGDSQIATKAQVASVGA